MSIINRATKELTFKIIYYGPPFAGKTTNLVQLHRQSAGKLVSLATSSDRILYFDITSVKDTPVRGFTPVFQIYTVPGQVIFNSTLQLVLRGVDGIVFVADSQYDKMGENVESFNKMEENLKTLKLDLANIPCVLQYSKQDLTTSHKAPTAYMEQLLNNGAVKMPSFVSNATRCEGVLETFNALTTMLLDKFVQKV